MENKIAPVTGSSREIGRRYCQAFLPFRHWLVINSLSNRGPAEKTAGVLPGRVAVGANEVALESPIRGLAVELGSKDIHVNAMSAAVIETGTLRHFASSGGYSLMVQSREMIPPEELRRRSWFRQRRVRCQRMEIEQGV